METPYRLTPLLVAVTLLLSACAGLIPGGREHEDVASLLSYNQRLATLSAEKQRREFAVAQQAFAGQASEVNRLRLALALCVPNAGWRDDGRLFKLLEDSTSLKADETSPLRHLALLLYQEVAERLQEERRLEGNLRDEKRRHETQLRDEKRRAEDQLRDEKHHAEELQGKLDSLMDIEREFSRRQRQKAPRP
jgi:hypothetical protein